MSGQLTFLRAQNTEWGSAWASEAEACRAAVMNLSWDAPQPLYLPGLDIPRVLAHSGSAGWWSFPESLGEGGTVMSMQRQVVLGAP